MEEQSVSIKCVPARQCCYYRIDKISPVRVKILHPEKTEN